MGISPAGAFCVSATSRGGGQCLAFLVGIRNNNHIVFAIGYTCWSNHVFDRTNLEMYRLRLGLDFRMVGKLSFVPEKVVNDVPISSKIRSGRNS